MDIKDDESGGTPLRGSQGSSAAVGNADTSIGNMSGLELCIGGMYLHMSVCGSLYIVLCIGDNSVSVELDGLDPQKRELLEARLMGRQPGQVCRVHLHGGVLFIICLIICKEGDLLILTQI